jgi:N-acetylmuramoyl-L-alanine amidase
MKKVMIDVGHGGSDNGAVANGLREKDLNLQVALKIREYLTPYEVEIKMTRETDKSIEPNDRVAIVLAFNPDLCVSVHHNSFNGIARGAETIHSAKEVQDDKLANAILDRLLKAGMPKRRAFTKLNDNGQDYYYMIRRINDNDTDAIITEGGFVDNLEDAKLLKTEAYINAEARAIADSVVEYLGLKLKEIKVEVPITPIEIQYPIIKIGSKGEYVKILQNKLKELGYTITVDGDFGVGTDKVVKQFQGVYKLAQDGIVGKNTWKVLMSAKPAPISIVEETKNYEIEYMNGYINIVKIPKDKLKKIDVILCKQPKETLSSVYNRLNPKPSFLLNGGLFAVNNGNSMSSMWDEGKKIVEGYFSDYGLYVKNDGSFGFGNHKQLTNIKDFIGASPSLIIDNKVNIDLKGLTKDKSFTDYRHPRTCIGVDDKYLYLVVVDGRQTGKLGMTINELANFGMSLKLKYFINLDGGGSSRLLGLNAKVINSPSENRAVDNCIVFYI